MYTWRTTRRTVQAILVSPSFGSYDVYSAGDGLDGDDLLATGLYAWDQDAGDANRVNVAADDSLSGDNMLASNLRV